MAADSFTLHPQLAADCFVLGRRGPVHVLMHRTAQIPWLLLVPETAETEVHRLSPELRLVLDSAAGLLGEQLLGDFACEKLNVAAIGNLVPQLHLHVVGRRRDDPLWPRVVWGNLGPGPQRAEADVASLGARWRLLALLD